MLPSTLLQLSFGCDAPCLLQAGFQLSVIYLLYLNYPASQIFF